MRRSRGGWRALGAATVLSLIGSGCSGDRIKDSARIERCRRICEASKSCPSPPGEASSVECYTLCDDMDAVNSAANCYTEFDKLYDCIERHGVCSDTETSCDNPSHSYNDCVAENCSRDPNRDDCGL